MSSAPMQNGNSFESRRSSDWDTIDVSMDSETRQDLKTNIWQHNSVRPRVVDEEQVGMNVSPGVVLQVLVGSGLLIVAGGIDLTFWQRGNC
eukprot:2608648-Amphidinium_carterae.1